MLGSGEKQGASERAGEREKNKRETEGESQRERTLHISHEHLCGAPDNPRDAGVRVCGITMRREQTHASLLPGRLTEWNAVY